LFPVVNFLKCVVIEVILFSAVAVKTLTFHKVVHVATQLRYGGIFGYSIIKNFYYPDSESEISL